MSTSSQQCWKGGLQGCRAVPWPSKWKEDSSVMSHSSSAPPEIRAAVRVTSALELLKSKLVYGDHLAFSSPQTDRLSLAHVVAALSFLGMQRKGLVILSPATQGPQRWLYWVGIPVTGTDLSAPHLVRVCWEGSGSCMLTSMNQHFICAESISLQFPSCPILGRARRRAGVKQPSFPERFHCLWRLMDRSTSAEQEPGPDCAAAIIVGEGRQDDARLPNQQEHLKLSWTSPLPPLLFLWAVSPIYLSVGVVYVVPLFLAFHM